MLYHWTFWKRSLLAISSGLGLFYSFWGILTLMINAFDISENLALIFPSFEILIFCYGMIFIVLPFCFPRICILPIWFCLFLTFIVVLYMAVGSVQALYDPANYYYSYPYEMRLANMLKMVFYAIFILCFLFVLRRPALFYFRIFVKKIIWYRS